MGFFKIFIKTGFIILIMSQFSCRKDFDTQLSSGNLSFSVDTLFLDTVFNTLSTQTYSLKVYNNSKNAIRIPTVKLARADSKYRMNVDGISGTEFKDVTILEKDSIFIFVEASILTEETTEMVYKDRILFQSEGNLQDINLVTLVQDVHFLFSEDEVDFDLSETTFTKDKPYAIYGNASVPKNGSLTIEAGSIVHFSENSSLTISEGASLNINGTLNDSIVFKGANLSHVFNQIPGQWDGIKIAENTTVNINYLKILNPSTGIDINNNTNNITLNNTEIYNASNYGISAKNANITANNLVIGKARKSGLFLQGGTYTFNHATLANYWSNGFRTNRNVQLANYYIQEDLNVNAPLNSVNFTNSIITGRLSSELLLDKSKDEDIFNFSFKNCMLKLDRDDSEKENSLYDIDNTTLFSEVLFNKKEDFRNTNINDLRIGLENQGIRKANTAFSNLTPLDITGTSRDSNPDIGAYQHIDFTTLDPEENDE